MGAIKEAMKKLTCSYCAKLTIDINSISRTIEFHKFIEGMNRRNY
jgi:hypothetical protein